MLFTRYATEIGSTDLPVYQPSASELAIMALKPSRWLEARTDRGLEVNSSGQVESWVDRARGVRYVPLGAARNATTGTGNTRRINFTGTATKALAADDSSDAFDNPSLYTVATVTRQMAGSFGGAPMGTGGDDATASFVWFNSQTNGSFWWFTTGAQGTSSGAANNDGQWRVHLTSVDLSQATAAAKSTLRRDGVPVVASPGALIPLADVPGGKRMTLGGAGRAGTLNPFTGAIGAVLVIPNMALHLSANAEALALVESYLASLAATLP